MYDIANHKKYANLLVRTGGKPKYAMFTKINYNRAKRLFYPNLKEEQKMRKFQEILSTAASKLSNRTMLYAASCLVLLGGSAVTLSAVPFWHNEPEMPQSMLDEILKDKG